MTVDLDDVHNASTDVEVYFIEEGLDVTPSGAVGAAKRQFREDYDDVDDVSAKKMRETRNGIYVMAMAKPEPNYLDQVALKVLRNEPQAVSDAVGSGSSLGGFGATQYLINEVLERVYSQSKFDRDDAEEALNRNCTIYDELVGQ